MLHTETVPFRRTKLPEPSRVAEDTPRPAVLDCQTTALFDPLTSRRFPSTRNWKEAVLSAAPPPGAAPPATQMGIPSKVMAAKWVSGVVTSVMNPNEKVEFREVHDWFPLETVRVVPGEIVCAVTAEMKRMKR